MVEYDLEQALAHHPQATLIANPTAFHLPTALAAAQANSHIFIEKPISHTLSGIDELRACVERNQLVFLVGFQFRFHPGLRQIKQWLREAQIGTIVSFQSHWGEYLPDWHPWEDYRQSYSAREALGGGVVLTLSHPLDYLRWLFGNVEAVYASLSYRGLDIEAEDSADLHLQFEQGVMGHLHLDYVQRPPSHWLNIIGTEGSIHWDNADGAACCYRASTKAWETVAPPPGFERNTLFADEMQHFLACVRHEQAPLCDFNDGWMALKLAVRAKESAQQGKTLPVNA